MTAPVAIYRHFDADGDCLWVGQSANPMARMSAHASASKWFRSVATISIEWLPDRDTAIREETSEIARLNPKHNVATQPGVRRHKWEKGGPLEEWRISEGVKLRDIAADVGISLGHVSGLCTLAGPHARTPSFDLAARIERATNGAVPLEAWFSPTPEARP